MVAPSAEQATSLVDKLRRRADAHKRMSENHRRLAQFDHEVADDIIAFFRTLGVRIVEVPRASKPEGGRE